MSQQVAQGEAGAAIVTEALTRDFGALRAVDSLSLKVPPGTVFGFLGPNGSGKTTTIRLLLGLIRPTSGRASVLGFDPDREGDEVRARCGALLEHHGLYERLSAEENLILAGRIWRVPSSERSARVRELLDRIGLWDRRTEPVGSWSRGMKQKVALARALFHHPRIAFLDEPTAGLDPLAATDIRGELMSLAREGTTVFLTTHNLDEAARMCDLVAVVRSGRLLATGPPDELRQSTGGERVIVTGRDFPAAIADDLRTSGIARRAERSDSQLIVELGPSVEPAALVRQLVTAGVAVDEVRRGAPDLNEAFQALVTSDVETREGDGS